MALLFLFWKSSHNSLSSFFPFLLLFRAECEQKLGMREMTFWCLLTFFSSSSSSSSEGEVKNKLPLLTHQLFFFVLCMLVGLLFFADKFARFLQHGLSQKYVRPKGPNLQPSWCRNKRVSKLFVSISNFCSHSARKRRRKGKNEEREL